MTQPRHTLSHRDMMHARRSLGLTQDRNPTVVVYRQAQAEAPDPWSEEDQAKLTLARLMRGARQVILGRVDSLPGSGASTELWIRYRQAEDAAQALGNKGQWTRALAQFRGAYARLLTAAPVGGSEPIGRGARGVGYAECPGSCRDCLGCLSCNGRRAVDDFVGLMKRLYRALRANERTEAEKILNRAKDVVQKLEPQDMVAAQVDLKAASSAIETKATAQGVGRVTGVGVGAYSDYFWFVDEVNRAKVMASRTGDVDGAKSVIDNALVTWRAGPYGVPTGNYQSPDTFAQNARSYAETFRAGSPQLQSEYQSATGGQQAYYASPEQQKAAAEQRESEKRSLELAQSGWFGRLAYESAPAVANPTGFASRDDVVERATGAPKGAALESVALTLKKVTDGLSVGGTAGLRAAWAAIPTLGKIGVAIVGVVAVRKAVR